MAGTIVMHANARRLLLYAPAGIVLAGLVWAGFVHRAEPDLMTSLGAADVQLRLAHGMPALDKNGAPLAARQVLLAAAAAHLDRAAAIAPDSPLVVEFQGFLCHLRGDPRGAAACYRRARTLPGCAPEQFDTLVFNESRMLTAAGEPAAALAVFEQHGSALQPQYATERALAEAELQHALGRDESALARLAEVLAVPDAPMAWVAAGRQYETMGRPAAAAAAYERAASAVPIAEYHSARLKLAGGDVDSSLRLLERAAAAVPAEVRRLLREEAAAWQVLAADARFRQLAEPGPATPGR